jgi:MerR family transcriptional regulator, redox-sensitive transcriptional activator SoxR
MQLLIGEIARRSGLSASALRYYERAGLIPSPPRVSKQRRYDRKILGRIRIICLARQAGFSINETRAFLTGYPATTTPADRWRALAERKLLELDAQIARLSRMQAILKASFRCKCPKLEDCETGMAM